MTNPQGKKRASKRDGDPVNSDEREAALAKALQADIEQAEHEKRLREIDKVHSFLEMILFVVYITGVIVQHLGVQ